MQDAEFSKTSATTASSADVNQNFDVDVQSVSCRDTPCNSPGVKEENIIVSEFSDETLLKMEVIQSLLENNDGATYTQRLEDAAKKLGKSTRTVRRMVDKWEQEGLAGFLQNQRADKGKHRVDQNWQEFVLKTYKEGNKGSKRMNRKPDFSR